MNWEEKLLYLQNLSEEYVKEAKRDYSAQRIAREQRYSYTTKKGIKRAGSHPKALEKAQKEIEDIVFSSDENLRKDTYEKIIKSSQMLDKFREAEKILNDDEFRVRLVDEVFKTEIEMLANDKVENESRTNFKQNLKEDKNIAYNQSEIALELKKSLETIPTLSKTEIKRNEEYYKKTAEEIAEMFISSLKVSEINRYKGPIKVFLELTNKKYLEDITAEEYFYFIQEFQDMPNQNARYNKEDLNDKRIYKSTYLKGLKTYREWIDLTRELNLERNEAETIGNKLININVFLNFAVGTGFLSTNRFTYHSNQFAKTFIRGEDDKRKTYRISQLESLFSSSWYTQELEKNLEKNPSRVWIPLILLYTGARINEIAQLKVSQIKEDENSKGVYYFKLKAEEEDQSIKNSSSIRKIPVHPKLAELGILKFLEKQKQDKQKNLFSDLFHTASKGYGQSFSDVYSPYRAEFLEDETMERILKKEILLDLHSFRHTFMTYARYNITEDDIKLIAGHKKNQTQKYGKHHMKMVQDKLSALEYDLDFSRLEEEINKYYDKQPK